MVGRSAEIASSSTITTTTTTAGKGALKDFSMGAIPQ